VPPRRRSCRGAPRRSRGAPAQSSAPPRTNANARESKDWLKISAGAGAGLAAGSLGVGIGDAEAAAEGEGAGNHGVHDRLQLLLVRLRNDLPVKDGKLVNLEGDPDHVINEGARCSKGAAMSKPDLAPPPHQAEVPRSGRRQVGGISWDEALRRVALKMKQTRDAHWIAAETDGNARLFPNRTDAIGFLGGAQNTNEECYLITKLARILGTVAVEHQARL